jgi:nucleoside-diphosphate-sugar epimerase
MGKFLVTGATGFVGRTVVTAFLESGDHVRAAVRSAPHPPLNGVIEVIRHPDLLQPIDWEPLVAGMDVVIHLAGIAHTGRGISAETYDRVNRLATEQAARAATQADVRRFIFISSIRAQSGPSAEHVLSERDRAQPTDDYGRSKLAAEEAVRASGVPFTVLRPVLLYGPGAKGNFAALMRAANSPWPLPVGQFTNRRSLLDIENFLSALRFVLGTPKTLGETYIVADPGLPPSFAELIATLREAQGRQPLLLPVPTGVFSTALRLMRRGDLWQRIGGDLQADPSKLITAGWFPKRDTASGLTALAHSAAC